jgi:hypothetical protein
MDTRILGSGSFLIKRESQYALFAPMNVVETIFHLRFSINSESMPDSSFTFQDLEAVLLNGEVHEPPEPDQKTGDFKYRVVGESIDGDHVTVIVVLIDHRSFFVITVF